MIARQIEDDWLKINSEIRNFHIPRQLPVCNKRKEKKKKRISVNILYLNIINNYYSIFIKEIYKCDLLFFKLCIAVKKKILWKVINLYYVNKKNFTNCTEKRYNCTEKDTNCTEKDTNCTEKEITTNLSSFFNNPK